MKNIKNCIKKRRFSCWYQIWWESWGKILTPKYCNLTRFLIISKNGKTVNFLFLFYNFFNWIKISIKFSVFLYSDWSVSKIFCFALIITFLTLNPETAQYTEWQLYFRNNFRASLMHKKSFFILILCSNLSQLSAEV